MLRSKSAHPETAANREIIHKIGVTGGDVDIRIAGAETSATYLFAGVEVVATHKLYNINRSRLENLLHRFFAATRADVEVPDRFGRTVGPRECQSRLSSLATSLIAAWRQRRPPKVIGIDEIAIRKGGVRTTITAAPGQVQLVIFYGSS